MNKFDRLYNLIMEDINSNNFILVENIDKIYYNLDIIYEDNKILRCPQRIVKIIKEYVNQCINSLKSGEFKIYIKDIIGDEYLTEFDDEKLYSYLVDLFKDKTNAYVLLKVQKFEKNVPHLTINRDV